MPNGRMHAPAHNLLWPVGPTSRAAHVIEERVWPAPGFVLGLPPNPTMAIAHPHRTAQLVLGFVMTYICSLDSTLGSFAHLTTTELLRWFCLQLFWFIPPLPYSVWNGSGADHNLLPQDAWGFGCHGTSRFDTGFQTLMQLMLAASFKRSVQLETLVFWLPCLSYSFMYEFS